MSSIGVISHAQSLSPQSSQAVRQSKAFTLIELLVVISIISLLISILLPALASARKSAIKIKCLANVRGGGQAMLMASQDRKGEIPDLGNDGGADGHFGGQNVTTTDGPYKINIGARDFMLQYGLQRDNFYCPNNRAMNTDAYWGPDTRPTTITPVQVVIGYQVIGGRRGFMRKNKNNSSSSFEAAKQSSNEWYKTSNHPGVSPFTLKLKRMPFTTRWSPTLSAATATASTTSPDTSVAPTTPKAETPITWTAKPTVAPTLCSSTVQANGATPKTSASKAASAPASAACACG